MRANAEYARRVHARSTRALRGLLVVGMLLSGSWAHAQATQVSVSASPMVVPPGTPVTLNVSVAAGSPNPAESCPPGFPCYAYPDLYLSVTGSNGFSSEGWLEWTANFQGDIVDPTPIANTQPTTYTVTAVVLWHFCAPACLYGWEPPQDVWEETGNAQVIVTPAVTPTISSVTPNSGSGGFSTFTMQVSSAAGAGDIEWVVLVVHSALVGEQSCVITYHPPTDQVNLWPDVGPVWLPVARTSGATLANSQCHMWTSGMTVTPNGTTLTVTFPLRFASSYSGAKQVFAQAKSLNGPVTDWTLGGSWTVPVHTLTVGSMTPSTGEGLTHTFAAEFSSTYGVADIQQGQLIFEAPNTSWTQDCQVAVNFFLNYVYLMNDAATEWLWQPIGTGGLLQNSSCQINSAAVTTSVLNNDTTRRVNVPITFTPSFVGLKNVYALMQDVLWNYNPGGWEHRASWLVACPNTVTPLTTTVPKVAGEVTISVDGPLGCQWSAAAGTGFLAGAGAFNQDGAGSSTYSYDENTSASSRSTQLVVAGRTVTVTQLGNTQLPSDEEVVYFHMDAIGSVRVVTDANGGVVRRHDFLPFGQEGPGAPSTSEPFMFAGHERDGGTKADYFGARYYVAFAERFATPDPLALTVERLWKPHLLNRYNYANSNPLGFVDPGGLESNCLPESAERTECPQAPPGRGPGPGRRSRGGKEGGPGPAGPPPPPQPGRCTPHTSDPRFYVGVSLSAAAGAAEVGGEVGKLFLYHPYSGNIYGYTYGAGGVSSGPLPGSANIAAEVATVWMDSPSSMSGHGYSASFTAAVKLVGVTVTVGSGAIPTDAQIAIPAADSAFSVAAGWAGGLAAGFSVMRTWTSEPELLRRGDLPPDVQKLMGNVDDFGLLPPLCLP